MARSSTVRHPAPVGGEEPEALTWKTVRLAAETYWPVLGARVVDQITQWNGELFDSALRPAPIVLSRMSSVHGHWFPLLDASADQRVGTEVHLVTQARAYSPPNRITSVKRADLLRGMMHRLRTQDGLSPFKRSSAEWCALVMQLHLRLTGKKIWAAPEREETEPAQDLGRGLYRPAQTVVVQDCCPETGAESLPRATIASWPGSLMDLGRITRD
jgi:hypothetical protein